VAYISRDPFAREELHREQVAVTSKGCWWCGMLNRFKKLFVYRVESDGGRVSPIRGEFCCVDCMRTYHD
jgi:hypothetical protein